jgi:hypothetical protein
MNITASATDKVAVQNHDDTSNKPGPYYLNTGIAPFLEYDIVYNLDGGTLTLVPASAPVPEIDPAGFGSVFAFVAAAFGLIEQRRRKATAEMKHIGPATHAGRFVFSRVT